MPEGASLTANVLAIHPDISGAASVGIVTSPRHGNAQVDASQAVQYVPDRGFNGADRIAYRIVTAAGATLATGTLTITVYQTLAPGAPAVTLPDTGLSARELAIVANELDPQSLALAEDYARKRGVPATNVIRLRVPVGIDTLTESEFTPLKAAVDAAVGSDVQALLLAWTSPYRVAGMSITSAFALGYAPRYQASGAGCSPTAPSAYYDSDSQRPQAELGMRPVMLLAGSSEAATRRLIDRGLEADHTFPAGRGYLLRTSDAARSVRWPQMRDAATRFDHAPEGLELVYSDNSLGGATDAISGRSDVLFYLTGLADVPAIATNQYRPGALADHLTSFGGILTGATGQMNVLRWLDAGAAASFGTVVEPCNYPAKFPDPAILIQHYYRGATAIEAYWKSVQWPGEGLFVGEPLARPFGRMFLTYDTARTLTIRTTSLVPGRVYQVQAADTPEGTYTVALDGITTPYHRLNTISLVNATRAAYRLVLRAP